MGEVTELLPVERPVVVALLHTQGRGGRAAALTGAVCAYCDKHELALSDVVADLPAGRDAFGELTASLARARVYGLVVPSRSHLGSASLVARRGAQLARANLRLLVIRANPAASSRC